MKVKHTNDVKIVECPRDAMQGLTTFIPTEKKITYLNKLLQVGFDILDFGSFVSAKAVPQMADTEAVLNGIEVGDSKTALLAIVANTRGAETAASFESINYLGFPLSISETFQQRNTNKSITEALNTLAEIRDVCSKKNKKLVTYISMGFGNPYGDPYEPALVSQFADILITLGTDVISLADTIGAATPSQIKEIVGTVVKQYTSVEIGVHLHANPNTALEKIASAYESGCRRFDGALRGFGGCPMAKDELVGNIATEQVISFVESKGAYTGINSNTLHEAMTLSYEIFPKH
ncbi:MAG TPA: hydroxymethylglutaryl-CoA lyase [Ohtaekwangia sp.]|nr:hydroxymethylglutaryl-CoA lyase [Ohtaekwangia sp.]